MIRSSFSLISQHQLFREFSSLHLQARWLCHLHALRQKSNKQLSVCVWRRVQWCVGALIAFHFKQTVRIAYQYRTEPFPTRKYNLCCYHTDHMLLQFAWWKHLGLGIEVKASSFLREQVRQESELTWPYPPTEQALGSIYSTLCQE